MEKRAVSGFPRYPRYRGTDRERHGEKRHWHESGSVYMKNHHGAYTERVKPAKTETRADTRKGAQEKQPGRGTVAQLAKGTVIFWSGLTLGLLVASYKGRR